MIEQSIPDYSLCQSKTGRNTLLTGELSVSVSENAQDTVAKEVQPILTVEQKMANHIQLPEAESLLLSPTSTTTQVTANPTTSVLGVNAVTSPMMPSITQEPENADLVLSTTTPNQRYSSGKKRNKSAERSRELQRTIRNDVTQLPMYQIQLENYKPFNDRVKIGIEVWGSSARCDGGEYTVRAKQIAAMCQMTGLNDPYATPDKRLAAATALLKGKETFDRAFEQKSSKDEWKQQFKKTLDEVADFFGLGNKKAVSARKKSQRKSV